MERSHRSVPRPPVPIAFAHRGASGHAPENTIDAFTLALALGATGLESDTWLAADDVPVLVHDRTVRRPGRRIDVTRRTSAELAEYGVPSLADLYSAVGSAVELSLDIEHEAVALPAVDVATRHGAAAHLWACSPSVDLLRAMRAHSVHVRLVCSTRPRRVPGGLERLVAELADLGADALNLHRRDWTPERVRLVHGAGLLAFGWDAQSTEAVSALVALGVDAVYSDWPDLMAEALGTRLEAAAEAAPDAPPFDAPPLDAPPLRAANP
jgi:glycerophosphoryl diester phosphodiesterase